MNEKKDKDLNSVEKKWNRNKQIGKDLELKRNHWIRL